MTLNIPASKSSLRRQLRQARRDLPYQQQLNASQQLIRVIRPVIRAQKTTRIALYLAMDGEIDLSPFINACHEWNIEVYLPVLHRYKPTLWFARYDDSSVMYPNKYGIPEPIKSDPIRPWQLTMVLFPLVGFDEQGGRLGMGGGFYDRTFANANHWPKKPKMFGVAHECQKVDQIPLEAWDIKLNGIFSDERVYLTS